MRCLFLGVSLFSYGISCCVLVSAVGRLGKWAAGDVAEYRPGRRSGLLYCSFPQSPWMRYHHSLWLAISPYFLILLGRELSWGRVFMLKTMTDHGPVFVSMHSLPHHVVIHGIIAVIIMVTMLAFIVLMPWRRIFLEIPVPVPAFFLIIAAAIVAAIADKGLLTGGPFDGNLEEEMELLVYLLQLYFVRWYYRGLEHGTQQPQ